MSLQTLCNNFVKKVVNLIFYCIIANQDLVAYKFDFVSKQDIYFTKTGRNVHFGNMKIKLKKEFNMWKIMFEI